MNKIFLGSIDYESALKIQIEERERVINGQSSGTVFFLEHNPPVITLGQNAGKGNIICSEELIAQKGYRIFRASRGGDVTVHEPGQLVIYFVMPLDSKSVRKFVNNIIDVISAALLKYSIRTEYRQDMPGLWVNDKKICALGFDLRGRASMHGVALNVCNTMEGFSLIVPCGLAGTGVTSIKEQTNLEISTKEVAATVSGFFPDGAN
ncbi:MAG: lipoyl(octanoyl) transferase LipB [Oligoflexia bacterium]|nr:lipoyl(octanoyl) transferase LipB [Oligoflexia bacterium]